MNDRETVITWLEICGENDDCSGCCPYGDDGETFDCRAKLMADALAMLKEQEPKVLTLEEVEKRMLSNDDSDSIFYAEVRSLTRMSFGVFQLTIDSKDDYVAALLGSSFPAWYRKESYGYKWRCWSAKPTNEQRQAVKWE